MPSVELAHVIRGERVESIHRGHLVTISTNGESSHGDPDAVIYPRSAVKPLQAAAMVAAGLDLPDHLLALASASHSGAEMHRQGAREILASVGLDEQALQCRLDLPYGAPERIEWTRAGRSKDRLVDNCSGKHAAMIATSMINGWPIDTYRDPAHPLQLRIASLIEEMAGERISGVTVDGCGAPLFALSIAGLARSIHALVRSEEPAHARVISAIRHHPEWVAGEGRSTTQLMQAVPGLIVKEGAEGVQVAAMDDGQTFAVKIDDGSMRALPVITAAVLASWGIVSEEIDRICAAPVLGGGVPIGAIVSRI